MYSSSDKQKFVDGIKANIDVSSIAENENFLEYEIKASKEIYTGENYSNEIVSVTISGKKRDGSISNFKIFVKFAYKDDNLRVYLDVPKAFTNESIAYNDIFPILYKLQNKVNMQLSERFKVPRCLEISLSSYNEFIAMEDISSEGFRKFDHFQSLDYHHLRLLLRKIANYHGTVFAMKSKKRDIYNNIVHRVSTDIFFALGRNKNLIIFLSESLKYTKSLLTKTDEIDAIDNLLEDLPKRIDYLTSQRAAEPYDIICHGDFWVSNLWFKYKENIPIDVCFLDWQIIRCGSLFTDLHYMMFLCTDADIRKRFHKDVFDWYYSDLAHVLEMFDMDIASVYPKEAFKNDEKKFAPYALATALAFTPAMNADLTNVPDTTALLSGNLERIHSELVKISEKGLRRVRDIVADYVSYGYD